MTDKQTLITYGSQYGSAARYARKFAQLGGFPVLPFSEAKRAGEYDRVIHFGALYGGGVLGLRQIAAGLSAKTEFVIVTVGLADVRDEENVRKIRKPFRRRYRRMFSAARGFFTCGAQSITAG